MSQATWITTNLSPSQRYKLCTLVGRACQNTQSAQKLQIEHSNWQKHEVHTPDTCEVPADKLWYLPVWWLLWRSMVWWETCLLQGHLTLTEWPWYSSLTRYGQDASIHAKWRACCSKGYNPNTQIDRLDWNYYLPAYLDANNSAEIRGMNQCSWHCEAAKSGQW